jgi:hypothetical protein
VVIVLEPREIVTESALMVVVTASPEVRGVKTVT